MRQGELFGLHWPEVDLERGTVRVVRSLYQRVAELKLKDVKTRASRRTVRLAAGTVEALHELRKRMLAEGRDVRTGPVFVRRGGGLLLKAGVYRPFLDLAARAGLPRITFHDLRHTSATLLLTAGVNVKAVASRLGHSTPIITLKHYAAWMPEVDERAAVLTQELLLGAIAPPLPRNAGEAGGA
jgi:integrase